MNMKLRRIVSLMLMVAILLTMSVCAGAETAVVNNIALMDSETAQKMGDRTLGALSDVVSQYELMTPPSGSAISIFSIVVGVRIRYPRVVNVWDCPLRPARLQRNPTWGH